MCSCSGNCNCNSSTIPRGPSGPQGPAATIAVGTVTSGTPAAVTNSGTSGAAVFNFTIPPGTNGTPGTPGTNGKNAYTITADSYTQPNIGSTAFIEVSDTSWMSVNQIIFVGNPTGTSNIGGYYKVTAITDAFNFQAERLNWSIPGVTFVTALASVTAPAIVQSSGTIGATGPAGANGSGITVIKSVIDSIDRDVNPVLPNSAFTLTTSGDTFLAGDLCPNNGDIGRITYEVVVSRSAGTAFPNISMDISLGIQGVTPFPQLNPYANSTPSNQANNKLSQISWNNSSNGVEYMYIKYVVDVQRKTPTTANIFIDWKTKSATTSNSGCYHNVTTITALNFDDPTKVFEFAVKGFNNSASTLTFSDSRFYVESLRLSQP